jgi:hypothetical protein
VAIVARVLANKEYCSDIARWMWRVRIRMAFDPEQMDGATLAYLDHLAAFLTRTRRLESLEVKLNQMPPTMAMFRALSTSAAASLTSLTIPMRTNFRILMSYVGSFHQLEVLSLSYVIEVSDFTAGDHQLDSVPEWRLGRLRRLSLTLSHCHQPPVLREVFRFLLRCELSVLRAVTISCSIREREHMAELGDFIQRQVGLAKLRLRTDQVVSDLFATVITARRLRLHGMIPTPAALLQLAQRVPNIELYFGSFDYLWDLLDALSTASPNTLQLRQLKLGMWRYRPLRTEDIAARILTHAHKLKERGISLVDCMRRAVVDVPLTHNTETEVIVNASPTVQVLILMS